MRRGLALAGWMLLAPVLVPAQSRQALRKSDLVRMLSGAALSHEEILGLIQRNCTSFTPSDRDREDLRAVGADDALLDAIAACRRVRQALQVTLAEGVVTAPAGSEAVVRAAVRRGASPAPGVTLILAGSRRLAGEDVRATSDDAGEVVFRVPLRERLGSYQFTVAAASGERVAGNLQVRVIAGPAGALQARARPARVDIAPRDSPVVTVAVRDALGNPVAGQTVQLVLRGADAALLSRGTNARGEAVFPLSPGLFRADAVLAVRVAGRDLDSIVVSLPRVAAPTRTGFVAGLGQRARVGTRAPQPVVFEVRDSANAPLAGQAVAFSVTNGRVDVPRDRTDSAGRLSAFVWVGERAGPVVVTARVARLTREATLLALAGPAAALHARCGDREIDSRLTLRTGSTVTLGVSAVDAFGNAVAVRGLRAAVGDDAVVRVLETRSDSAAGAVVLTGRRAGSTNLALSAAGVRANYVAAVVAAGSACGG